jgi:hypothetical protein
MTAAQLAIVACLGLVLLGTMGGAAWLILSDIGGAPASQAGPGEPTPSGAPEQTPTETAAPLATVTLTPTETPVPYESLIPEGWNQFGNLEVEFWLPPGFVGGDVRNDLLGVAARIAEAEPQLTEIAEGLGDDPPDYWFWALDVTISEAGYQAGIGLDFEDAPGYTPEQYGDALMGAFTADVIVLSRTEFDLGAYPAHRMELEASDLRFRLQEVIYLIQEGDRIWHLVCSAPLGEFFEREADFDQVARTFRTLP